MKAFSVGQYFRFPDNEKEYIFNGLYFVGDVCIIMYEDDGVNKEKECDLIDLIHI